MDRFFDKQVDLRTFSPLTLAYIGDGVYELMMREYLLQKGNCPSGKLHALTVAHVRAEAQAEAAQHLMHLLTEEEMDVLKRGRNAHFSRKIPQKASVGQYHLATGLEAVFGWLYLKGERRRLTELFGAIVSTFDQP